MHHDEEQKRLVTMVSKNFLWLYESKTGPHQQKGKAPEGEHFSNDKS
jgi:hypothetical protein